MKKYKVTIIGAGFVGSTIAHSLVEDNTVNEVALIDINTPLVKAQVMDLRHAAALVSKTSVTVGSMRDVRDSDIVVVACGASGAKSRLDLLDTNAKIMKGLLPKIFRQNPDTILLMVTNPVDVLTYQAIKMFPGKKARIIGSGTVLDSARLHDEIAQLYDVAPSSVRGWVMGEHGDSQMVAWSSVTVNHKSVDLSPSQKRRIEANVKTAATKIIQGKQATYYGVGSTINYIVQAIIRDTKEVLPLSHVHEGEYGIRNICLSTPVVIGARGIIDAHFIELTTTEQQALKKSATVLIDAAARL